MAFSAIHPSAGRIDATLPDLGRGLTWTQVHKARPRVSLLCPDCGHGTHARVSRRGLRHFAHDPGRPPDCAWLNESLEHHQLKLELASTVRKAGWRAELEVSGPDGAWRADVLATSPDRTRRIAWEAQLSPITDDDILYRTHRYWDDEVEVCWVSPDWPSWMGIVPSIRVTANGGSHCLTVIEGAADFSFKEGAWRLPRHLPLVEFIDQVQTETVMFYEVLPRYRNIRIGAGRSVRRQAIWASSSSMDAQARHEQMRQRQDAWKQLQQEKAEADRKEEERQRAIELAAERVRLEKEREQRRKEEQRQWEIQAEQVRLAREKVERQRQEVERQRQEAALAADRERQRQDRLEAQAAAQWHDGLSDTRTLELRNKVVDHLWRQEWTKTITFDPAGPTTEHAYGTAIFLRDRLYGVLRPSPASLHRLPNNTTVFALNAREAQRLLETHKVSTEQMVYFDFPDEEQLTLL